MTCRFDHFLLSFHISVTIVRHWIGNIPVEVLNLGQKRYVESLFTNGKTHLLRNVIDKIIYHKRSNNDLKKLQLLLWEQWNREQHTLAETYIWYVPQVINVILWCCPVLISHFSGICRREVFVYRTRSKWFDYISTGVIRQTFYSVVHRPKIWSRSCDIHSPVSRISTLELWWNLTSVETGGPF